jgi:hypothetical protein
VEVAVGLAVAVGDGRGVCVGGTGVFVGASVGSKAGVEIHVAVASGNGVDECSGMPVLVASAVDVPVAVEVGVCSTGNVGVPWATPVADWTSWKRIQKTAATAPSKTATVTF